MAGSEQQRSAGRAPDAPHDPSSEPPSTTSRPLGDALPTPVEPGLDEPLPPKEPPPDDKPDTP